jgi:bla regulator protein blaR1
MILINNISHVWWNWMGAMLWQVSLVIIIIGVLDFLIKSWVWPQVRYALWLLVFVKLIIPPTLGLDTSIVSLLRPGVERKIIEQFTQPVPPSVEKTESQAGTALALQKDAGGTPEEIVRSSSDKLSWHSAAFLVWSTGVVIFFTLLSVQMIRLRRWHDQQNEREIPSWFHELLVETSQKIGVRRLPAIVFHDKAKTPAVYGLFRPVMLLPAHYFNQLSREEARHVVLHELAHLKRGDLWLHGFSLFMQIVYWFNPLMVWARQQLKHVREICCDLTVAGILKEKTSEYRKTLLNTARGLLTERVEPGLGLMGVFEEPFRLVTRLEWLEKGPWNNRSLYIAASVAAFIIVASLILPMDSVGIKPVAITSTQTQIHQRQNNGSSPAPDDKITSTANSGCYFINEISWIEEYNWWSKVSSSFQEPSKFYLCDRKASLTQDNLTFILDKDANSFTLVSHRTHSYVVMDLPLDIPHIWSDELKWIFKNRTTSGEVKPGRQKENINGRISQMYNVTYWRIVDGKKGSQSETVVWASTDVPFDLELHEQVLFNMRRIFNRDDDLQQELLKIKGAQTRITIYTKRFPRETRYCSEIIDILEQAPPVEALSIPENYIQKEKIEPRDLGFK